MSVAVEQLLQQNSARLWRAREKGSSAAAAVPAGLPTGYAALDRCLPGAGWPRQGLIEILDGALEVGSSLVEGVGDVLGTIAGLIPFDL